MMNILHSISLAYPIGERKTLLNESWRLIKLYSKKEQSAFSTLYEKKVEKSMDVLVMSLSKNGFVSYLASLDETQREAYDKAVKLGIPIVLLYKTTYEGYKFYLIKERIKGKIEGTFNGNFIEIFNKEEKVIVKEKKVEIPLSIREELFNPELIEEMKEYYASVPLFEEEFTYDRRLLLL